MNTPSITAVSLQNVVKRSLSLIAALDVLSIIVTTIMDGLGYIGQGPTYSSEWTLLSHISWLVFISMIAFIVIYFFIIEPVFNRFTTN